MIGALLHKGINFLLIPVYMHLLTPREMGLLDFSNTIIVLLCILFAAGLPTIWQGDFFKHNSEQKRQLAAELISTYVAVVGPLAMVSLLILQLFQLRIFGSDASVLTALAITLTAFLTFFQTIFRNTLELSNRPVTYVINSIIIGLFGAFMNIALVIWLKAGYVGALSGNLVGMVITFVHAIFEWKKRGLQFTFIKQAGVWAKHLKVSLPFISIALANWIITSSDRWFIKALPDKTQLGLYGVATKFASAFDPLLIAPILSIYTPFVYKRFAESKLNQKLGLLLGATLIAFALASIVVAYAAKYIITPEYISILPLIPILIMGFAFYLVTMMSNCALIYYKKPKETLYIIFFISVLNIGANSIIVPAYGIYGASITFLLSNIIWTLLSIWRNSVVIKEHRSIFSDL